VLIQSLPPSALDTLAQHGLIALPRRASISERRLQAAEVPLS
jgi:hypothetical protein